MAEKDSKNPNHPHPQQQEDQEEATLIPVLSVLKNNAILKHIVILNNNNIVLVGRHPKCDIVLTHPSVSRYHLRVRFDPSSRSLSLLDLSSVHGTWVNGRKLDAGLSFDMKEGDTFTVGVSTRVYRLIWVPFNWPFDSENPFVLELDAKLSEKQEQVEIAKNVSFCIEEIQLVDSIPECDNSVLPDENLELTVGNEIPSPEDSLSFCCDEERKSQSKDEIFEGVNGPLGAETSHSRLTFDREDKLCKRRNQILSPPYMQSVDEVDNAEKIEACPEAELLGETNLFCTLREYLRQNICLPVVEAVQGTKMQQLQGPRYTANTQLPPRKEEASIEEHCSRLPTNIDSESFDEKGAASVTAITGESEFGCTLKDNDRIEDILTIGSRIFNSENSSLLVEEAIPATKFQQIKITEGVAVDSMSDVEKQEKCYDEFKSNLQACICPTLPRLESLNSVVPPESIIKITSEKESQILEDIGNKCSGSIYPISLQVDLVNSSVPQEADLKITNKKENQSLQTLIAVGGCSGMEILENCVEAIDKAESYHEQRHSPDETVQDMGNKCTGSICPILNLVQPVNSSVPQETILEDTSDKENQTPRSLIPVTACSEMEILESCVEATESAKYCHDQGHPLDEAVEDIGNECSGSIYPISVLAESVNSSVTWEADLKITNKKENQTPQSLIPVTGCFEMETLESCVKATEKSSNFVNIRLRRGKAASSPQARTRKSRFMSTSNVGTEVEMSIEKDIINKSMPKKGLFSVFDCEEKAFTQNKENFSPNMRRLLFMRNKGKLDEIKHSKSQKSHSSDANFSPNIYSDESKSPTSNRENQASKVVQERKSRRKHLECHINWAAKQDAMELKKNRAERVPFQSLTNSGGKRKSRTSGPVSACGRISDKRTKPSHINGEQRGSWDMVVDTASLLNKGSREALQLLQGLKGTRLIIPRSVIRELDSMRRQFRIFRRISEASLALEWIEECMANTKWWIHIQSSMEECRLISPTPPALPQTQFIEEIAFPGPKGSKEIASPTVEDDILDCALLYRRKENNRQLVLLSDDVPLKIKSMAEGLLCETVPEFRQSLVNPFSKRFMWTNSSPRGLTWSCQDDVVLREKYYGLPSKAGLKLITEQYLYSQV